MAKTIQTIFDKVFEMFPNLRNQIKKVSSDFDKGSLKGIKDSFPDDVEISGCLFHYKQVSNNLVSSIFLNL